MRQRNRMPSLHGGRGYTTEVAGRDRFKFFRPAERTDGMPLSFVRADLDGAARSPYGPDGYGQEGAFPAYRPTQPMDGDGQERTGGNTQRGKRIRAKVAGKQGGGTRKTADNEGVYYDGEEGVAATVNSSYAAPVLHLSSAAGTTPSTLLDGGRSVTAGRATEAEAGVGLARTVGIQTMYAEREAQTDPYSPDYIIHHSFQATEDQRQAEHGALGVQLLPEELDLAGLTYGDGLPAGQEEVALIERIRRRREVTVQLPQGGDKATVEKRLRMLSELEHEEWAEREAYFEAQMDRRQAQLARTLERLDNAQGEAAEQRLTAVRTKKFDDLQARLEQIQSKRLAALRRLVNSRSNGGVKSGGESRSALPVTRSGVGSPLLTLSGATSRSEVSPQSTFSSVSVERGKRGDVVVAHALYGPRGHAVTSSSILQPQDPLNSLRSGRLPAVGSEFPPARSVALAYDIQPAMLIDAEGLSQVEATTRAKSQGSVRSEQLQPPINQAIGNLKTYYQRREATKVIDALEYATAKIARGKGITMSSLNSTGTSRLTGYCKSDKGTNEYDRFIDGTIVDTSNVHELYRATPLPERPDTPELLLHDQPDQKEEEAIVLLQRLLRGRAIQNDFFEGRERCRGLIGELQAASEAKEKEKAAKKELELAALAETQDNEAQAVLDAVEGRVIHDALDYLFKELRRRQDAHAIDQRRMEAESTRAQREQEELQRREAEQVRREREEVQWAAYAHITDGVIETLLHEVYTGSVESAAERQAIVEEVRRIRIEEGDLDKKPEGNVELSGFGRTREPPTGSEREALVCGIIDQFLVPLVCQEVRSRASERIRQQATTSVAVTTAANAASETSESPSSVNH